MDSKDRILAAAEAEFLASGYDRSRMQAIADRAEVNKAMVHYHFGSKDELFAEIFRQKTSTLFPKVAASLGEHSDFIALMCAFVDIYIGHLAANRFLPFYLLQISANHADLLEQLPIDLPGKLVQAFEAAAARKTIRPHDARQFIISLLGMCVMPFVAKNLIQHVMRLDDEAFEALLAARAEEIKRYVVLLLTPEPQPKRRR